MSFFCWIPWIVGLALSDDVPPPAPLEPVPTARQLAWQRMEMNAFIHFTVNTFTDREWGDGTESPEVFAPTALDCDQWASVCREAGFGGIILTAKHHDGFCLWPSKYTDHTVASSPWRDGEGDVLRELSEACREHGLKLGVYTSPWDRHEPSYGDSDRYNEHFRRQLREVLTGYGEIFEVWFDGANGEGPNGKRQVYDWPSYIALIRELQPGAVIFSDAGPDVRWVGNERGIGGETSWSLLNRDDYLPGTPRYRELTEGQEDGTHWVPPEMDVSIRPGWFYHPDQDGRVKTGEELLELYEKSVGRNGVLLLNLPPNREGRLPERDVTELREMSRLREATYGSNLASKAEASASAVRGDDSRFGASQVLDGDLDTYWALDDGQETGALELTLPGPILFDRIVLQEPIRLGQRVKRFRVEARLGGEWREIARGTTIGHKRILRAEPTASDAVRIRLEAARACPLLAEVGLHLAPPEVTIDPPGGSFYQRQLVTLSARVPGTRIHYTLDGSEPTRESPLYEAPIALARSVTLKAKGFHEAVPARRATAASFRAYREEDLQPAIHLFRAPDPGLRFAYYEGRWSSVAALEDAEPEERGECLAPTLSVRRRDEHFGLLFEGYLRVPESGVYELRLSSDDGSRLWIGDELVVDHDGLHGMDERRGAIGLEAGWHTFRLAYFNATGGRGLQVAWKGPDARIRPIPEEAFGR